jgi:predicted outer membrane protein
VRWIGALAVAAVVLIAVLSPSTPAGPPTVDPAAPPAVAPAVDPVGVTQTEFGPLTPADVDLLIKVRQAGLWEMPTGQQMQQRATSEVVQEVGRLISREHNELDGIVRDTAEQLGVALPSQASGQQQAWMAEISAASGSDYDRLAVNRLRQAHGKVLPVIASVRSGTSNELVREFATTSAQFVTRHHEYLESTGLVDFAALTEAAPTGVVTDPVLTAGASPTDPGWGATALAAVRESSPTQLLAALVAFGAVVGAGALLNTGDRKRPTRERPREEPPPRDYPPPLPHHPACGAPLWSWQYPAPRRLDPPPARRRRFPAAYAILLVAALLSTLAVLPEQPDTAAVTLVAGSDPRDQDDARDRDDEDAKDSEDEVAEQEFPGRDEAGPPARNDFVDIADVAPRLDEPEPTGDASTGSFVSDCGRPLEQLRNSDNWIVAPGKVNGAQHMHDYVGNAATDAFTEEEDLVEGETTCALGDASTYFWPALRDVTRVGDDEDADGGGLDGNEGRILRPAQVVLQYRGNPAGPVEAMPPLLRAITGDAKAATNGDENARAQWTCRGFEDRFTDRYPLCPDGSRLMRVLDFPSCWDGESIDSEDHRSHIVFPEPDGECPGDTVPVPALRMVLAYDVPQGRRFALDGFPDQRHDPRTDHADFTNVMPPELMDAVVECINSGRRC